MASDAAAIQRMAKSVEIYLDDDEGISSLFIEWQTIGQYSALAREEGSDRVYCELFDQANGAEFDSIRFSYSDDLIVLEVSPPETFIRGQPEHRVEINVVGSRRDKREIASCLYYLFPGE